ncbi:pentapeptide repeat-containing protein [Streptomyces olivaceus]|uniref:pentapeptide repeat-containing protein n=1 Tax=Streptomyces olivaceus TaxID=47716 RepID=UPI003FF0E3BC
MFRADLAGADLREANLREANLDDADLSGADLGDAEGLNLTNRGPVDPSPTSWTEPGNVTTVTFPTACLTCPTGEPLLRTVQTRQHP